MAKRLKKTPPSKKGKKRKKSEKDEQAKFRKKVDSVDSGKKSSEKKETNFSSQFFYLIASMFCKSLITKSSQFFKPNFIY
jgi:hypothetical protein